MLCREITICELIGVFYLVNTKLSVVGKTRKELIMKQNFEIIFAEVVTAFPKWLQGTMNFTVVKIQTDSCESKCGRFFDILPQKLVLKLHMLTNCFNIQ